ncbi:hypothetical protein AVEN_46600-1 [Araneus ventricosus]|uniref:Uncharacterized protein n=1 Tax=Araneus ventricosus TaxID=182803 RepID=A0A4Y2TQQ9_ARAVE|nr:hypothetical protein AVEN_193547-1 [Araneus ventricosus]GBO01727.1 hypothetical protein AVEN_46600-1 [Araneus ventricosus]
MGLFLPSEGWDELQSFDCSSLEEDGTSFKVLTVRVWEEVYQWPSRIRHGIAKGHVSEDEGDGFNPLSVNQCYSKTATPAETEADVALYVGVFVAVAVFIVVVIAMVMLVRRIKGRDPCMYRGAGTGKDTRISLTLCGAGGNN